MTAKDSISVSLFVCEKGERVTSCKGGDSQEVEGGMVGEAGHNTRHSGRLNTCNSSPAKQIE